MRQRCFRSLKIVIPESLCYTGILKNNRRQILLKNRWYLGTFLMLAGFLAILVFSNFLGSSGMTTVPEAFPELMEGTDFQGRILWAGEETGIPVLLTDEQYLTGLASTRVREKEPFEKLPSPAFEIRFAAGEETCLAVVGKDGAIKILKEGDPEGSGRFFLDRTGSIFRALYEEHLLSGGRELP